MELFLCVLKWGLVVGAAALILRLLRPVLGKFNLVPINVRSQGAGVSEHYWK